MGIFRLLRINLSSKEIQFIYDRLSRLGNDLNVVERKVRGMEVPGPMLFTYLLFGIATAAIGTFFALEFVDVKEIPLLGAGNVPMSTIVVLYFQLSAVFFSALPKGYKLGSTILVLLLSTFLVAYMSGKQVDSEAEQLRQDIKALMHEVAELRDLCCITAEKD